MSDVAGLTETERLLLLAAIVHELHPGVELHANCAVVVGQALLWSNLVDSEVRSAWHKHDFCPVIAEVYGSLISMAQRLAYPDVRPDRPGEPLFEAIGDLGTVADPGAFPHFTACRLTEHGQAVAIRLMKEFPEYPRATDPRWLVP